MMELAVKVDIYYDLCDGMGPPQARARCGAWGHLPFKLSQLLGLGRAARPRRRLPSGRAGGAAAAP
jgi:hypothetical protein